MKTFRKALTLFLVMGMFIIILSTIVGCGSQNGPTDLVEKYLSAKKWEDRLTLVRNQDKVEPLMAERYRNWEGVQKYKIYKDILEYTGSAGDLTLVRTDIEDNEYAYWLVKENGSYKIDWEASVEYNPMSWTSFTAQRVSTPTKFRLFAQLDDYYNYEYDNYRDSFWSFQFQDSTGKILRYNGYVNKLSPDGVRLFNLLKDGHNLPVILELSFPPYFDTKGNVMQIDRFVADGWVEP